MAAAFDPHVRRIHTGMFSSRLRFDCVNCVERFEPPPLPFTAPQTFNPEVEDICKRSCCHGNKWPLTMTFPLCISPSMGPETGNVRL